MDLNPFAAKPPPEKREKARQKVPDKRGNSLRDASKMAKDLVTTGTQKGIICIDGKVILVKGEDNHMRELVKLSIPTGIGRLRTGNIITFHVNDKGLASMTSLEDESYGSINIDSILQKSLRVFTTNKNWLKKVGLEKGLFSLDSNPTEQEIKNFILANMRIPKGVNPSLITLVGETTMNNTSYLVWAERNDSSNNGTVNTENS